jgi:hypothetical protein
MEYTDFKSFDSPELPNPPRPVLLWVLCILTFINTGFSLLSLTGSVLNGPLTEEQLDKQRVEFAETADEMRSAGLYGFADMMDQLQRMSESVNQHFYANVSVSFLVLCLGIVGAVFMFVGKKSGFHLYIAYSLLAILQMYFFTSVANIPTVLVVMSLIFSALFIFLYAKNLSWMRAL